MIKYNCVVNVSRMTGDETNKQYQSVATGVRVLITPASNELIALYGEMPVGGLFSFLFINEVSDIKPEDKIILTDPLQSAFVVNDEFIVSGITRKSVILTQKVIEGVCIKK